MSKCSGLGQETGKDFGMAVLEYKRGISFAKTSAVEVGGFARRQLVVSGTKGSVEIKPLERYEGDEIYTVMTEYETPFKWGDVGRTVKSGVYDRYGAMMASFAAMVCGEKENPWGYDYELELYRTILKCCGGANENHAIVATIRLPHIYVRQSLNKRLKKKTGLYYDVSPLTSRSFLHRKDKSFCPYTGKHPLHLHRKDKPVHIFSK